MYVAYAYHTWMESCACQLNFDTKMSGLAYVPREQGILLTVEKNPGPQPDTASYILMEVNYCSKTEQTLDNWPYSSQGTGQSRSTET